MTHTVFPTVGSSEPMRASSIARDQPPHASREEAPDGRLPQTVSLGWRIVVGCRHEDRPDGAVVAVRWDEGGCIDTFALRQQGDAVLFHPKQAHTLMVECDSQVVVVRFAASEANPNERVPLDLPSCLVAARNEFLSNPRSVAEAVLKGSREQDDT